MTENQPNEKRNDFAVNMKSKVMEEIKAKKIRMRSPLVFLAEKLGMESALAVFLIFSILLVSLIFYFLKKNGLLKFLSLGMPGVKVFFQVLPYDYIVLFIIAIILAVYLANKIELFQGNFEHTDIFIGIFLIGAIVLGIIIGMLGAGDFFHGWNKKKIPKDMAIHGKIETISPNFVVVENDDGELVSVYTDKMKPQIGNANYTPGKFLRAVGTRDKKDANIFHAEQIRCCDDD
jgi:hypothetical protein